MKTNIRKAILACIIALATTVAVTPAHATYPVAILVPSQVPVGADSILIVMAVFGY